MKFGWSIVLLLSILFSAAVPLFFGHGLAAHENAWFGYAGICFLIAAALFFVQKRFRADEHAH
ncbi:MAG TPA: hypothetical protein VM100_03940 [Longimicrobiales bacterium]|nr:hypothetical protein [Longimicrobiales bacterium]